MTKMEHYSDLAKAYGLTVSGVRYRLRTGKPLGVLKGVHRRHKTVIRGVENHVMCLSCREPFPPMGKFNRICSTCREMPIQKSIFAEVI